MKKKKSIPLQVGSHRLLPGVWTTFIGSFSTRQLVQQEMSPSCPHWPALHCHFGAQGCGRRVRREQGVGESLLVQLSGKIPAHRHGRSSTGNPNGSQLGWRGGSLRWVGVRAAHVCRSQLLSPGCRCLFPWASRSCPFHFPWLPPTPLPRRSLTLSSDINLFSPPPVPSSRSPLFPPLLPLTRSDFLPAEYAGPEWHAKAVAPHRWPARFWRGAQEDLEKQEGDEVMSPLLFRSMSEYVGSKSEWPY